MLLPLLMNLDMFEAVVEEEEPAVARSTPPVDFVYDNGAWSGLRVIRQRDEALRRAQETKKDLADIREMASTYANWREAA